MARELLKTALHHWWPVILAKCWTGDDGMVGVIRADGEEHRAPPGKFGAIKNAHHIKFDSPWDSSFEPVFDQPDNEIIDLVSWLAELDTKMVGSDRPRGERLTEQRLSEEHVARMARVTASLLARSPSVRYSIKRETEHRRRRFGFSDPIVDKTLIAANQQRLYDEFSECMMRKGRWAVLFSDEREFVAGDGFFHDFPSSRKVFYSKQKLLLPVLPTAAIAYMLPRQYPTAPKLVTLRLSGGEVSTINEITQLYSGSIIFYREDRPKLSESFSCGAYLKYECHRHDWLNSLLNSLSQYRGR